MQLVKVNRMWNGLQLRVVNPATNKELQDNEVINLDDVKDFGHIQTIFHMYNEGDLVEHTKPLDEVKEEDITTTKTIKKLKE